MASRALSRLRATADSGPRGLRLSPRRGGRETRETGLRRGRATSIRLGSIVGSIHYEEIITIEPGKRGGKPCIRGLRITVHDVLEYLASGMTEAQILADFPDLTSNDMRACLAFAADRERR
jgi:uncharacterized protein (DUF433 family)